MSIEDASQNNFQAQLEREKLRQADLEVRAAIDTETVHGLQLINGGLAAGLVTMLPTIVKDPNLKELGSLMIIGSMCAVTGLVAAVVHNRLRRKCSLEYSKDRSRRKPPYKNRLLVLCQTQPGEPHVCTTSAIWMWSSIIFFALGAFSVGIGFMRVHPVVPEVAAPCWELQRIGDHVYKFNRCTGMAEAYSGK